MSIQDLQLFTAATMNGYKPVIFLEEVGVPYELTFIDFAKQEQKTPEYLKLNPNGKIPTLVDRREGRAIFESGAILWHLAERFGQFLSTQSLRRSETLQWLFFQVAHVGPMMGQAMFFQRIAAPNGQHDPYAISRYVDESRRLLEVLDKRLEGRDYLVGDYSIADMATYPWARAYVWAKVKVDDLENLKAWFQRIDSRSAVQRAMTIPRAQPQFWDEEADDGAFGAENASRFAGDVKRD